MFAFHAEAIAGYLRRPCLQTGNPCVPRLGSCPIVTGFLMGDPELEACLASSLAMRFLLNVNGFYNVYKPSLR